MITRSSSTGGNYFAAVETFGANIDNKFVLIVKKTRIPHLHALWPACNGWQAWQLSLFDPRTCTSIGGTQIRIRRVFYLFISVENKRKEHLDLDYKIFFFGLTSFIERNKCSQLEI